MQRQVTHQIHCLTPEKRPKLSKVRQVLGQHAVVGNKPAMVDRTPQSLHAIVISVAPVCVRDEEPRIGEESRHYFATRRRNPYTPSSIRSEVGSFSNSSSGTSL